MLSVLSPTLSCGRSSSRSSPSLARGRRIAAAPTTRAIVDRYDPPPTVVLVIACVVTATAAPPPCPPVVVARNPSPAASQGGMHHDARLPQSSSLFALVARLLIPVLGFLFHISEIQYFSGFLRFLRNSFFLHRNSSLFLFYFWSSKQ